MGNEIINNIFHGVTHTISTTVVRFGGGRDGAPALFWDDTTRYKIKHNIFFAGSEPNATVVRVQTENFFDDKPYTEYSNQGSYVSLPFSEFLVYHPENYIVDPKFVDPENQNFALQAGFGLNIF